MTHAADPRTQTADSGPMLSPNDYHWAERRGDTTGSSLLYALGVTLLILSVSFTLSTPGHQWTTVTLATGFMILIALGFTSKRRKARSSLSVSYHLVSTVIFLGCLFFLFSFDQDNLNSLYWRLPLATATAFIYYRFFAPSAVKVPGQPGRSATHTDFTTEPYLPQDHSTGRP
ncbi:hypothetical protein [Rothia sp. (in: high G+C Gram-positive bacteria)]|uniref:hypothetical protein n=1 Tax=Rothia sp. (in: high G+C Gram-positive bacteria) TaxID=1885016 RepID=UPI003217E9D2